jgi:uncharacterized protein YndB with AHSA1/START domain
MTTTTTTTTTETEHDTGPAPSTVRTVSLAIKAEPAAIWAALTDGAVSPAYYYGFAVDSSFDAGAPYTYRVGDIEMITGRIESVDAHRSLSMTFNGAWSPEVAALPESFVIYELSEPAMPTPGVTILTLRHVGMPDGPTADGIEAGWVLILSGLKTLLETGEPLARPVG